MSESYSDNTNPEQPQYGQYNEQTQYSQYGDQPQYGRYSEQPQYGQYATVSNIADANSASGGNNVNPSDIELFTYSNSSGNRNINENPQYAPQSGSTAATFVLSLDNVSRLLGVTYLNMFFALLLTAATAYVTTLGDYLFRFLSVTGTFGLWAIFAIQVGVVVWLSLRVMTMNKPLAYALFYGYAALNGFTLSSIAYAYTQQSIAMVFVLCAGFYLALTMLAFTAKIDMMKFGPTLFVGLIILVISQLVLIFFMPDDTTMKIIAAIGVIIFCGLTMYDTQKARFLFTQYGHNRDVAQRLSIICALNLYLDFINMFLYLLRLLGKRN